MTEQDVCVPGLPLCPFVSMPGDWAACWAAPVDGSQGPVVRSGVQVGHGLAGAMDAAAAYHRVDAARRLLVSRPAEASGRLFFAKRVHQALKHGDADLDAILEAVVAALDSPEAQEGARLEREEMGRVLDG